MSYRAEYKNLVKKIDAFKTEFNVGDGHFSVEATGNGRFMERLLSGGRFWPETIRRAEKYIETETKSRRAKASRSQAH